MIRPRIGLLVPYVSFYEKIAPVFTEKVAFAARVREHLLAGMDVVGEGLVTNEEEALQAGRRLALRTCRRRVGGSRSSHIRRAWAGRH